MPRLERKFKAGLFFCTDGVAADCIRHAHEFHSAARPDADPQITRRRITAPLESSFVRVQVLIHFDCGIQFAGIADDYRRHACDRRVRRNVFQHHAAGADL
jgi:hypothetical protein